MNDAFIKLHISIILAGATGIFVNLMMFKFCNKKTKSKQVKTKQSKEM